MKRLIPLLLLLCLPLYACAEPGAPGAPSESPRLVVLEREPTQRPTATPEPDMIIEDDGDIILSRRIQDTFTPQIYNFDRAPVVLIYHTHAAEAFRQTEDSSSEESSEFRTLDNEKNVVAVGEALKAALEAQGFTVIHDSTNVEAPELRSAYSRSLTVMESYENVDIYIDLHRNAADARKGLTDYTEIGGENCARMFFVVGTGIGTYEGEYDVAPDWESNYAFAASVGEELAKISEDVYKPIRLKVGRYNQHVGLCLLAEIGTNANTLAEVLSTVPHFAAALRAVCDF